MPFEAFMRRLRIIYRPDSPPPTPPPPRNRAELLRELEVDVPAPQRIVGWDRAGDQRLSRT